MVILSLSAHSEWLPAIRMWARRPSRTFQGRWQDGQMKPVGAARLGDCVWSATAFDLHAFVFAPHYTTQNENNKVKVTVLASPSLAINILTNQDMIYWSVYIDFSALLLVGKEFSVGKLSADWVNQTISKLFWMMQSVEPLKSRNKSSSVMFTFHALEKVSAALSNYRTCFF